MTREYTFEDQLTALRALLFREDFFENPYRKSTLSDIKPLVIYMEVWLKECSVPYDRRRDIRLDVLSFIVGFSVDTTYDLTSYQSHTIYGFLVDESLHKRLGFTGGEFLAHCKEHAEASPLRRERTTSVNQTWDNRTYTGMSSM